MVNFKKLFFLSFLFFFIFSADFSSADFSSADFSLDQISNGMSKEEIAALEEIMKMSPEDLAAMEKEIQNVLNDLPPEERDEILKEAARFEEQLISNIKDNSFLNPDLTNKKGVLFENQDAEASIYVPSTKNTQKVLKVKEKVSLENSLERWIRWLELTKK